ncbi:MAG: ATP-binding cassette domain-containing protein, partial [Chloroflexota bacterium]
MPAKITATDVTKTYASTDGDVLALDNFNLTVETGEFVCIVGPSGCGKSTFL